MSSTEYTNYNTASAQSSTLLEWFNYNMHRNYPLADSATGADPNNGTQVPYSLLCDACIEMPPIYGSDEVVSVVAAQKAAIYLSSISRTGEGYRLIFSYKCTDDSSFEFMYADIADATAVTLGDELVLSVCGDIPEEYSALEASQGILRLGTTDDISGVGIIKLSYTEGQLDSNAVRIGAPGIALLRVITADEPDGVVLTGDVTLEGGENCSLSVSGKKITITADIDSVDVDDYVATLKSRVIKALGGTPIVKLNDISGPSVDIVGGDCTSVTSADGRIVISNPCATPCCSEQSPADVAAALAALTAAKERLLSYFTSMSSTINALQARLSSFIATKRS